MAEKSQFSEKILEILVCPVTHGSLFYNKETQELISKEAGLAYPIRKGIPIMLPEEARSLSETEKSF
jgi:hypothetical protein